MSQDSQPLQPANSGLKEIKQIVAISSCKGGVGKSTTSLNLALTLKQMGYNVGLFDADVYGPSLPTMLSLENQDLFQEDNLIIPLDYEGLKLMSFGYIPKQEGSEAAIMRGPMVTQIITQLLSGTNWGELDYLIIDYPPGTGDIQLTLSQIANISAALIVTTPQQLSFVDVIKGIQMFDKLKVPTLGVLENMAYYEVNKEKHYLFGKGAKDKLVELYGFDRAYEIPVETALSELGDTGKPFVLAYPDSKTSEIYQQIAREMVEALSEEQAPAPVLSYNVGTTMMLTLGDGTEYEFEPIELRMICKCALCVDEFTGVRLFSREDVDIDLYPAKIRPMGNYAAAVEWSDGKSSCVFPFDHILKELIEQKA